MDIRILSREVSSLIAAGEVIESPASVVKELIDNAIDAGSSRITVRTSGGGIDTLSVSDDGKGIPSDQAAIAFERYATSKVATVADLHKIGTLGFRGEALYSIAAVSGVKLTTKFERDDFGTEIKIKDGGDINQSTIGVPKGTTVEVVDIFSNFPARKKFLRSVLSEKGRIHKLVQKYALCNPLISFTLIQDNKTQLITSGKGSLREVVNAIYGHQIAEGMIEIDRSNLDPDWNGPVLTGLVGLPSHYRANRSHITIFVNRRLVSDKTISYALEQSYRGLMPVRKYPIGIINLDIDRGEVDVNVHPTKAEIKFQNPGEIFSVVERTVRPFVLETSPVKVVQQNIQSGREKIVDPSRFWLKPLNSSKEISTEIIEEFARGPNFSSKYEVQLSGISQTKSVPVLRVLGQILRTYILCEGEDGLYILDQHAAHERVMFEKLVDMAEQKTQEIQTLMEPVAVTMTPHQIAVIEENKEIFDSLGLSIDQMGPETYLIRTVPIALSKADPIEALNNVLDSIAENTHYESWEEKAAYSAACHSAIRAGQILSTMEMEQLVRQLEVARQPHTCPHGRPTMINLSKGYLERQFLRKM